ncbi:MAG: OmpA family protein [Hyphomicrobium sp.]
MPPVNQQPPVSNGVARDDHKRGPTPAGDAGPPNNNTPPAAQNTQPPAKRESGQAKPPERRHPRQARPTPPPVPPATQPTNQPKKNVAPPPVQAGTPPGRPPRGDGRRFSGSIDDIKRGRRQRTEDGGKRTIIEEPGNRVIVQEKGAPAMIRHDEAERMSRNSRDVRKERRPDGGNLTIAIRPGGVEVYSEFDSSGRLMRRYRRDRGGRETDLIDNRRFRAGAPIVLQLGPPRLRMRRDRYIMDYTRASDDDLYDALMDGPVDRLERGYSLDEIRYNAYLRDRMRRVDLDTVNFEFGSWQVPYDQYRRLERIANIINRILDRHPGEVFLIEGHTDAVGSELDNLTLSDRRAEEVAVILTETFNVPPENLITQGYGEEFPKVPTLAAEPENRRVAVRRITPLLARRN